MVLGIMGRAPFLTTIYYAFLSSRFRAEQRKVAAGIRRYFDDGEVLQLQYRMRRGIHRLEKGLSMRSMKPEFGVDYITEVIEDLEKLVQLGIEDSERDSEELSWYLDVLERYFRVCRSGSRRFHDAALRFNRLSGDRRPLEGEGRSPRLAGTRVALPFGYEEFRILVERRRSIRWFLPDTVSRAHIDLATAAAIQSPSACNRQAVRIVVIDAPEDAKRIGSLAPGARGLYENFPALAVLVGDLSAFHHERDRHVIYVDGGLMAMSFMFALESLGLSSCAMNWPDDGKLDAKAANLLNLNSYERVVLMIAFGHPDPNGYVPYSQKRHAG